MLPEFGAACSEVLANCIIASCGSGLCCFEQLVVARPDFDTSG